MTKKITHKPDFISYTAAVDYFSSEDDLIAALEDGHVVAVGDCYQNPEADYHSPRVHINPWCWRNYKREINGNLSGGTGEHGCAYGTDDPIAYRNVEILVSSIHSLEKIRKNKTGRPHKYNWDEFWQAVAFHLFMAASEEGDYLIPKSLNDWVANAGDDYGHIFENQELPSTTMLKEKLRPLWKQIEKEI